VGIDRFSGQFRPETCPRARANKHREMTGPTSYSERVPPFPRRASDPTNRNRRLSRAGVKRVHFHSACHGFIRPVVVHGSSNSGKVEVDWRSSSIKNASLPESDSAVGRSQVDGTARMGQADTQHTTPARDRRLACKPEYPRGESCHRWCRPARPRARGNLGGYAEEDVIVPSCYGGSVTLRAETRTGSHGTGISRL